MHTEFWVGNLSQTGPLEECEGDEK